MSNDWIHEDKAYYMPLKGTFKPLEFEMKIRQAREDTLFSQTSVKMTIDDIIDQYKEKLPGNILIEGYWFN